MVFNVKCTHTQSNLSVIESQERDMRNSLRSLLLIVITRLLKAFSQRLDHPSEPVKVESAQCRIADNISNRQPWRDGQSSKRMRCGPYILVHPDGLICTPKQTATSKSCYKRNTIDQLSRRSSHM